MAPVDRSGRFRSVRCTLRSLALSKPAGAVVLVLSMSACSSGSGGAAPEGPAASVEGGAGGDRPEAPGAAAAAPGTPGDGAMNAETQDPSRIDNVMPEAPTTEPSAPSSPAAAPEPSAGCGQLALVSSGAHTLDVDDVSRSYLLDVSSGYDGATPLPLVFAFHGATTSGASFRSPFYGNLLSAMGDAAIVVHPDALGEQAAWNNEVDLPFFDALLAALEASACVDEARIFATGHSSGGFFTNTLGCQRGDVLRAIAPVSAGGPFGGGACSGDVAVWLAHAENDQTVSFDRGVDSRDRWLEANGCSEMSAATEPSPCVEYAGCGPGLAVRWCVYDDGHDWPDFGPEGIWGFFSGL